MVSLITSCQSLLKPQYPLTKDAGTAAPSFASSALEDLAGCGQEQASRQRKIIMDVAATTFAGQYSII